MTGLEPPQRSELFLIFLRLVELADGTGNLSFMAALYLGVMVLLLSKDRDGTLDEKWHDAIDGMKAFLFRPEVMAQVKSEWGKLEYLPSNTVEDVASMIRYLKSVEDRLKNAKVTLMGCREVSVLAPIVARRGDVPVDRLVIERGEDVLRFCEHFGIFATAHDSGSTSRCASPTTC